MSDTIEGFINRITPKEMLLLEKEIYDKSLLAFTFVDEFILHNYPDDLLSDDIVQFDISDYPDANSAGIYLEEWNYDPSPLGKNEFNLSVPILLEDRIKKILEVLEIVVKHPNVNRMAVSINRCSEIEEIKTCDFKTYKKVIMEDCLNDCPPNKLYIINE
ncbi:MULTISPECIES: hypothetical protein [unclassified Psychrobacter]|uniref:hypothetical protein n=1 Tax=unclassified Psychrobacter TaxID=196806 RepID=UPI0025B405FA|nr:MULTISPECIES: hypothetical protein [unclassified Psychrobacter]MDN3454716.1 hypothetical protein [Psychrobacter sp. APC 3350]MDN3503283.1 hypothetical protein [Psychrobacter sp. 5A.1]